jgi:hypothetical protein
MPNTTLALAARGSTLTCGQLARRHLKSSRRFFNDQVLLLDHVFVHRLTGIEGKDGNPLNEVRVLCNSLLLNDGKLQGWPNSAGASIKLPTEKSVLKLKVGDDVKLNESDFVRLSKAFFAEIEKRYL